MIAPFAQWPRRSAKVPPAPPSAPMQMLPEQLFF